MGASALMRGEGGREGEEKMEGKRGRVGENGCVHVYPVHVYVHVYVCVYVLCGCGVLGQGFLSSLPVRLT